MKNMTEQLAWKALLAHHQDIKDQPMREWFDHELRRFERFSLQSGGILLDYSRNRLTDQTLPLLTALADSAHLRDHIEALFSGQPVNLTERRPALHMALRDFSETPLWVNGKNITPEIQKSREKLLSFSDLLHSGQLTGITGKPFTDIVNIGIGGSHLGPMMATHALRDHAISHLRFHFISSVDKAPLNDVIRQLDPASTLFIISSKSFTTLETLTNAQTLMDWLRQQLGSDAVGRHLVAVTAKPEKAAALGIPDEHIFPIWDWVGGRYSLWSAMGLPLLLMIGRQAFLDFLKGAHEMDQHFRQQPFSRNMPVILALLSIWYVNFFDAAAQAIAPYSYRLKHLVAYLQQAVMESGGKSVNLDGQPINYPTGPILFGEEGCEGQHSYHQLLHQGKQFIPVDFILVGKAFDGADGHHHDILLASALSQAEALMRGQSAAEIQLNQPQTEHNALLVSHRVIPGNRPSNILLLNELTPKNLGALIALYEHKIFAQSVIWNINPFDQWGVELGKQLLPSLLAQLQDSTLTDGDHATLLQYLKKIKGMP